MDHWYCLSGVKDLRQGEVIFGLPIYVPQQYIGTPIEATVQPATVRRVDGIILTPSCDLVERATGGQDKSLVVICQHWDLKQQIAEKILNEKWVKEIERGKRPRYYLLPASPFPEVPTGMRVVDFSTLYTLPKSFLEAHVESSQHRLRLVPPFNEHFAQAFARCYMRIGLPMWPTEYSEAIASG